MFQSSHKHWIFALILGFSSSLFAAEAPTEGGSQEEEVGQLGETAAPKSELESMLETWAEDILWYQNTFERQDFVSRRDWGAKQINYVQLERDEKVACDPSKERCIQHHSVCGHDCADEAGLILEDKEVEIVREIETLHVDKLGWADIGYHFMVGPSGKVYEGRPLPVLGAHTGGFNEGSIGIGFLGCYDSVGCPKEGYRVNQVTDAMIEAAAKLSAFMAYRFKFELSSESLIPRSTFDTQMFTEGKKPTETRFPYSPGDLIIARQADLLEKAQLQYAGLEKMAEELAAAKQQAADEKAAEELANLNLEEGSSTDELGGQDKEQGAAAE